MKKPFNKTILERCKKEGIRLTGRRKTIVSVLEKSRSHPSTQEVYELAVKKDSKISIATVYRTLNLLYKHNILERLDFGDGISRYETASRSHHDHLIDMNSGEIIEFFDNELEHLQKKIAKKLGYKLCGHRMELYGVALQKHE